jgi:hypothetical protein
MSSSNHIICSAGEFEDNNNILCVNNNVGKCTAISVSCGIVLILTQILGIIFATMKSYVFLIVIVKYMNV